MALLNLTEANFNENIKQNNIVILDFWAPWCGPCRSFAPIYEKTAEEYPDILFGKVNTEEEEALGGYFQIRSIPTIMIMREQIVVFNQAGALPEEALKDVIKQVQELDMDVVRSEIEKQQKEAEQKES
ncbi:Thiosulfate sulfurtransferase, rhodanese [hydrothermal vent metagenome]|uniref:Thiosulfate sulfurtransferase, rhodanese n=1 Tax=hydrothermal vent metagenome TaxID=652676 RepID=A0A1W1ECP1_9ZZZZ